MTTLRLYKSYSFKDKDPMIDELRTACGNVPWRDISADSGVSYSCMHGWFQGTTKRPQFATAQAVARSRGYTFKLVRMR